MSIEQIEHAAYREAWDPAPKARASHKAMDKLHKWKKPRNIANTLRTAGSAAIPIPGVGVAVDHLASLAVKKAQERSRKKKAETALTLEKEVKHGIKTLSVSEFDRARSKVTAQVKAVNELLSKTGTDDDLCELCFNLLYRYERARARSDVLRAQAMVFLEMAERTLDWCDQVDRNLSAGKPTIDAMVKQMYDRHNNCGRHCAKTASGHSTYVAKTGYLVV